MATFTACTSLNRLRTGASVPARSTRVPPAAPALERTREAIASAPVAGCSRSSHVREPSAAAASRRDRRRSAMIRLPILNVDARVLVLLWMGALSAAPTHRH